MVKFRVEHRHPDNSLSCGCLQGFVFSPYCKLTERLGDPKRYADDGDSKLRVEWQVTFSDGTCCEIYDWHTDGHLPLEQVRWWHIGGFSPKAVELVGFIMDQPTTLTENVGDDYEIPF